MQLGREGARRVAVGEDGGEPTILVVCYSPMASTIEAVDDVHGSQEKRVSFVNRIKSEESKEDPRQTQWLLPHTREMKTSMHCTWTYYKDTTPEPSGLSANYKSFPVSGGSDVREGGQGGREIQ